MVKILTIAIGLVFLIGILFVFGLIFAWPVMLMTNYIFSPAALTAVFGGQITFWKSFWLLFLSMFLFKSGTTTGNS